VYLHPNQMCQDCGYIHSLQPITKICPDCKQHANVNALKCMGCGYGFQPIFSGTPAVQLPPANSRQHPTDPSTTIGDRPSANSVAIALMWTFTVIAYYLYMNSQSVYPFGDRGSFWNGGTASDGIALVLAICLTFSKNGTDKANGWVKIVIEMMGFIIGFFIGANHPRGY